MLATLRLLLLALVALAACTPDLLAGVTCVEVNDTTWVCSGDGEVGGGGSPPIVFTNVVGVCTNCIAISPSECNKLKGDLDDAISQVYNSISSSLNRLEDTKGELEHIKTEGDSFYPYYPVSAKDQKAKDTPQFPYFAPSNNGEIPSTYTGNNFAIGVNSIYTYYDQGVKPFVDNALYYIDQMKDGLMTSKGQLSSLDSTVLGINCSACTASFGEGGSGTGGGSSGGGSDEPSSGCPCKEQFTALQNLFKNDFLPRVKNIESNTKELTNLVAIARDQLEVTRQGFHDVTNLFNRLDDYVLDDLSNRVYQIRYDLHFIASNLFNAQFYVRQDSDTSIAMPDLDDTLIPEGDVSKFDWGEFENLPWFTRVEYLLLKLNGVYVSTNNSANAGVSEAEENQQQVEDSFSDFKSSVNGDIKSGFSRVGTSISTFFSSFNSAVSTQGDKVVEIQLMSNFIGQEPLMLNIDPDVADACRTISSLLWTVLFGFLLYKIMINFWVLFVDTINWWVNQTQGFVK